MEKGGFPLKKLAKISLGLLNVHTQEQKTGDRHGTRRRVAESSSRGTLRGCPHFMSLLEADSSHYLLLSLMYESSKSDSLVGVGDGADRDGGDLALVPRSHDT